MLIDDPEARFGSYRRADAERAREQRAAKRRHVTV